MVTMKQSTRMAPGLFWIKWELVYDRFEEKNRAFEEGGWTYG